MSGPLVVAADLVLGTVVFAGGYRLCRRSMALSGMLRFAAVLVTWLAMLVGGLGLLLQGIVYGGLLLTGWAQ